MASAKRVSEKVMNKMSKSETDKQLDRLRGFIHRELRESVNDIRLDALYQQLLMQHVFERPEPLSAMTSWSIAPEFAWWLFRYVMSEKPRTIVELGSGTSTLVVAAALKKLGVGRFISFEHDVGYFEKTNALLELCGLKEYVDLIYAPLDYIEFEGRAYRWYSLPMDMLDHVIGKHQLDLLLVDGPPASTNFQARFPALPILMDYCHDSTLVILDDADRDEEKSILERWKKLVGGNAAYDFLSNIRHGPANFRFVGGGRSECSVEQSSDGSKIDSLKQSVKSALECQGASVSDAAIVQVLDGFYRFREKSVISLKEKNAALIGQLEKLKLQAEEASRLKGELEAANRGLSVAEQENKRLKIDLNTVQEEKKRLKGEVHALSIRYRQVYSSLVYQLGVAFYRQSRSIKSWVKLPLAIYRVFRRHSKSGNPDFVEYSQSSSTKPGLLKEGANGSRKRGEHWESLERFLTADMTEELKKQIRNTSSTSVLWVASQIADQKGYGLALQFAEENVDEIQRPGLAILRANMVLQNEQEWLHYFNGYLDVFELARVALRDDFESRFLRLHVPEALPFVSGPLISVIMPAHNAEKTIKHAAQSILGQTWKNLELIIVDDCSTDRTWSEIHALSLRDERVIGLRNVANVGPYVSKNLALRIAKGEFITGQDADDWSHPQRLERDMALILGSGGDTLATLSCMLRMNMEGQFGWFSRIGKLSHDGIARSSMISLLISARLLREVLGGWDSVRFGADSELIARLERLLPNYFRRVNHVGMVCLESESGLTNHPVHGVSPVHGISPVRQNFKDAFGKWHQTIDQTNGKLPFPLIERKYPAPNEMLVSLADVEKNITAHNMRISSLTKND